MFDRRKPIPCLSSVSMQKNYGRTCRTLIGHSFCMGVEYVV
ncbi:hypothetical protein BIFDEN_02156 [Bifidobacterium dentium ATCC 27678]|nr:hypothetical protein BIFDEN_02156 [Bifidobacterium dentium ATCC 27678]